MNKPSAEVTNRLIQVGNLCTQYSFLDYLISQIVWKLLKLNKGAGVIITGSLDIRVKIDMAISLSEHFKEMEEVRKILQAIKNNASKDNGFIPKRNLIVHGIYSSVPGSGSVMVEHHRKFSGRIRKPMNVSFVVETSNEIAEVSKKLLGRLKPYGIDGK